MMKREYRIENLEFSMGSVLATIAQPSNAFNILSPIFYILHSTSNISNP